MLFIGEIGINHNGDLQIAKELIKHAKDCGCDIVKFQKRTPDICVPEKQKSVMRYNTPWGDITYIDYKHKIEFGKEHYDEIHALCQEIGIDWTASAWDLPSQQFLQQYKLKYNKVASSMTTNLELLEEIASEGRYTFISTGMSTLDEIADAVSIFKKKNCPFELMHCVSVYPMDPEHANLKVMETLREKFDCPVGYSGHETGLQVSLAAVALGATSVERHITLDRSMWGTDQAASLGKEGLRRLVRDSRVIEKSLGDGVKRLLESEEKKRATLKV